VLYRPPGGAAARAVRRCWARTPKFIDATDIRRIISVNRDRRNSTIDGQTHGPRSFATAAMRFGRSRGRFGRRRDERSLEREAWDSMKQSVDGRRKMSVETVPDPEILNRRDAIVRISSTCICGSDLPPLYVSFHHGARRHHGPRVHGEWSKSALASIAIKLKIGDRVCAFTIACGNCFFLQA